MNESDEIYKKLRPEEWNYEAKIISREKIRDVLVDVILKESKRFVCLITPYWTWKAVKRIGLTEIFTDLLDKNINILLFGREKVNPKYFHNLSIFNYYFTKLNIRNCWLVKQLHSKLYYNEKHSLITSANFTATSLDVADEEWNFNFEEAILLKLKPVPFEERAWITFNNLNPFEIPPYKHLKSLKNYPKKRFLIGLGYEEHSKIKTPSIFSFPEMMKEWLLSEETINSYNWEEIKNNKLIHLGEKEDFCPICKEEDCNFSRTFICPRFGIEYSEMVGHCNRPFSCDFGPIYKTHDFFNQKCPITVFYCPNKDIFYDPAKNEMLCRGFLKKGIYGAHWEPEPSELFDPMEIERLNDFVDIFSKECEFIDPILFCSSCGTIIEKLEKWINFLEYDNDIQLLKCPKCEQELLNKCPKCSRRFININLKSNYFYCEFCHDEIEFQIRESI